MQWLTAELVLVLLGTCAVHAAVPFQSYILAPPSRIIKPVSVHQANGSVSTASGVLQDASAGGALVLNGTDAGVTYDFGKVCHSKPSPFIHLATRLIHQPPKQETR